MVKSKEEQIRALLVRCSTPPLEVVIPILEKAGRGEKELASQMYERYESLARDLMGILNLEAKNMRTLAKMYEIILGHEGQRFEPAELSETRFSFTVSDCPMMHVGKDVGTGVKSKFCDIICSAASEAFGAVVLGSKGTCSWDKALIKGAGKCRVVFDSGKRK